MTEYDGKAAGKAVTNIELLNIPTAAIRSKKQDGCLS